jgi:hypothetical protein
MSSEATRSQGGDKLTGPGTARVRVQLHAWMTDDGAAAAMGTAIVSRWLC